MSRSYIDLLGLKQFSSLLKKYIDGLIDTLRNDIKTLELKHSDDIELILQDIIDDEKVISEVLILHEERLDNLESLNSTATQLPDETGLTLEVSLENGLLTIISGSITNASYGTTSTDNPDSTTDIDALFDDWE